jgi:hypothetical protein
MKISIPEGINEGDYEAIEAAVMETVRGRWFLSEFARRSRVDEMRQMLDAIAKLEQVVVGQRALPADPSIRLLVQRLKEVGQQLDALAADMREDGQDEALCLRLETQARAVSGLLRVQADSGVGSAGGAPHEPERVAASRALPKEARPNPPPAAAAPRSVAPAALPPALGAGGKDARLAALARLDALPAGEKLALFS